MPTFPLIRYAIWAFKFLTKVASGCMASDASCGMNKKNISWFAWNIVLETNLALNIKNCRRIIAAHDII